MGEGSGAGDDPAATMIAALWRAEPPRLDDAALRAAARRPRGRRRDRGAAEAAVGEPVVATLSRVALQAEMRAVDHVGDVREGAVLLADTARALHALLARTSDARLARDEDEEGDCRPDDARLRVARMERWLSARAQTESYAQPAADLCLWALEHLERRPD